MRPARSVPVRVAREVKRAVEHFLLVGDAIAVRVLEEPDVGDGPGEALPGQGLWSVVCGPWSVVRGAGSRCSSRGHNEQRTTDHGRLQE